MVVDHPQAGLKADSVPDLLDRRADELGAKPFLHFKDSAWSYAALADASCRCAAWLKARGVARGERVALVLANGPEFIAFYFAIQRLGAIAVPVNPSLKEPEIEFILKDSGAAGALVAAGGASAAVAAKGRTALPDLRFAESVPATATPEPLLAFLGAAPLAGCEARTAEDAAIIYTSGTTGFPKGAVLTHANYLFDVAATCKAVGMSEKDRFLCFLPLFHVNAQVVTLLTPLMARGSMVLMERFQPKEFFELLSRHRCTAFSGVPSVYAVLLGLPDADKYDLSSLRMCICGAAPMPVEVFEKFEAKFKAFILEGFGLSEGTCVSSVNPLPPGKRKVGSIGVPIEGQEMAIQDDAGRALGPDQVGEIVVRGANVMRGYWNNPKASAEALKDGWLHTGDLGRADEEGYYFISGRKKEMIIRGGENIYPKEIEEALYRHPKVAEAAVIGLPDRRWGEEVAAFLVLRQGESCTRQELTAFLKERLADYKLPRRIEFVEALPKTATGKIQKLRLRAEFLARQG